MSRHRLQPTGEHLLWSGNYALPPDEGHHLRNSTGRPASDPAIPAAASLPDETSASASGATPESTSEPELKASAGTRHTEASPSVPGSGAGSASAHQWTGSVCVYRRESHGLLGWGLF